MALAASAMALSLNDASRRGSPAVRLHVIVGGGSVGRDADDGAADPGSTRGTGEAPGLDQTAIAPVIAHRGNKEISAAAGEAMRLRRAHRGDDRHDQRRQYQGRAHKSLHHATL